MACYEPPRKRIESLRTLYKIGSGPSSSHTMGPKNAALRVLAEFPDATFFRVHLYGSLALTGKGHKTDYAIIQVLTPERCEVVFHKDEMLPFHTNGFVFEVSKGNLLAAQRVYYSVGGGDVVCGTLEDLDHIFECDSPVPSRTLSYLEDMQRSQTASSQSAEIYAGFGLYSKCVERCLQAKWSLERFVYELENRALLTEFGISGERLEALCGGELNDDPELQDILIESHLMRCWAVMKKCIEYGLECENDIIAPLEDGKRLVCRRYARAYYKRAAAAQSLEIKTRYYIQAYTLAVSENNGAATHDVVTSPTCGACGILPGVLYFYYKHKMPITLPQQVKEEYICDALAVAGLIGNICKVRASVSGAEAGCEAEVGVACSMAAAAVVLLEYKTNPEYRDLKSHALLQMMGEAAKDALQNLIGLTCDPVGGLVLIPCMPRNGSAALKAYDSGLVALSGFFDQHLSFDEEVSIMFETGADLPAKYRETAQGGHATMYGIDESENITTDYSQFGNADKARDLGY